MKKGYIYKIKIILILMTVAVSMISCKLTGLLPYETVRDMILFDHIVYDGTPYYLAANSPHLSEIQVLQIDEVVKIAIVDENGNPYDAARNEDAWAFVKDPDRVYLYYGSAYYTRDTSLASEHYGFEK